MRTLTIHKLIFWLTAILILRIVVTVVLSYRDYFPANFQSDFLLGRESYFFGSYRWAFYAHIISGPISLVLGLILLSEKFRRRFPSQHRLWGRVQVANVLLMVAPSGLWMAFHVEAEKLPAIVAGVGFGSLAIATGVTITLGWRAAVQRRFEEHRQWMWRCYVLLGSAVVIRLMGGISTLMNLQAEWIYPTTAWLSWILPWIMFETFQRVRHAHASE